ncbi:uncharacterized protein [Clytia hemisphaerica]|uniref:Uncharacterized protein n=1 Tax=Clytia hemisphaerica TaxID=252671 RepID=A0A7M5VES3_9CNID
MISRLYFEIKTTALETSVRKFHTLLHPISEDQQFFHEAVYLSSNTTTNEFFSYVEYYDPVFYPGYYSMMNRFYRKVTEPMESAFVNGLRYSIQTDVTFCGRDVECDASKPTILQQLRSASLIPSFMQSNIPLGKFRIKFLQGGKCMNSYQSGSNMVVIGDAKCRDVWAFGMHLYPEHPFSLWNIELGLRITGDISKQLQISDSANSPNKHHYALGVNKNTLVLPTSPYNRGARCVLYNSNNNKVELSNTELIGNAGHCTAKKNGHVKFLPDYSAHYDRLNMKSLMTTTITSGEDILLVCDPKRDLKVKSNCHYSKDKQFTWTGLPSLVTQITFYIPSDDLFYGYCNEVKYHCSWSLQSNKVLAMDDASYNGKLADVSKVVASNLDAQSLWLPNNVQIFSQDGDIGVNSLAIYKAENGWKKIYHWTN